MAKTARKITGCIVEPMHEKQIEEPMVTLPIEVESSSSSSLLILWGLSPGERMKIERFADCPAEWQPHKVCGQDQFIDENNCEAMLFLPGQYRLSMDNDAEWPEGVRYELIKVNSTTVSLYFEQKRACCCDV